MKRADKKIRGIVEKVPGSGVWWVQFFDANGRRRREKAGTRGMALDLLTKRRAETLRGEKLPETLRNRPVTVQELIDAAVAYGQQHHRSPDSDHRRSKLLAELFGEARADNLNPQEIEKKLSEAATSREWQPATFNRYRSFLSLAFRLGIQHGKVGVNPARLVRQRHEDNARIRWLTAKEEVRLRAAIEKHAPAELPAFLLSLHTGMRRSEQYNLTWDCVDLGRRQLTIPRSKHGGIRYVPLNDMAVAALQDLKTRGTGTGPVMVARKGGHGKVAGQALKTPREWFTAACSRAEVSDYTWHCNRHTFASRLVMAGVGLAEVKELMGHKTFAMTLRYAHLAPAHQLEAVKRLDTWGRKTRVPTATRTATSRFGPSKEVTTKTRQLIVGQ
ncbi:MAG: tyrosine-type recombinase/integrase [Terriglobales bacterium]